MTLKERYTEREEMLTAEIALLKRRGRWFVAASLSAFVLAVAAVVAFTVWGDGWWIAVAAVMLAGYIAVRRMDIGNSQQMQQREDLRSVYRKELAYLAGDFSGFDDGQRYADPKHPFTFDLDIFGPESLFQRINRTVTTGGSDWLARELSRTELRTISETEAQRTAVNELAGREELRARWMAHGQRDTLDTAKVMEAIVAIRQSRLPHFVRRRWSLGIAVWLLAGFAVTIVLAAVGDAASTLPLWWAMGQFVVSWLLCARSIRSISRLVNKMHRQLQSYVSLVELANQTPLARELEGAVGSFAELKGLLDDIDRRGNELWAFLSNALFLGDYFILRRYLHWQSRYATDMEAWIGVVSRFDGLVSMATFRYNEPSATDAEWTDSEGLVCEANELCHPFLGAKAVRNDFRIGDTHYYIITGANMAGKSTFLRAVGINYVLARCGMPVFARRLRVSVFSLFSSMRTTDDLSHGISYFNAELLRLQQLIAACRQQRHTLIILDEILKGTNSLDKLNGSRLFLESILQLPVTGIIATHDLELSKMQQEHPDRFHNYCFEIELSEDVTYTYRITEGVARNQNATYLLQKILNTK